MYMYNKCIMRMKRKRKEAKNAMAAGSSSEAPPFPSRPWPDPFVHQILDSLATTNSALRMSFLSKQCEGARVFRPSINFVEPPPDDVDEAYEDGLDQHRKFVNTLKRYLEYRETQVRRKQDGLRRFRLGMLRYIPGKDASVVDEWLAFCFQRGVKELDISLRISDDDDRVEFYHPLSDKTFLNATSLTSLKLDHVSIHLRLRDPPVVLFPNVVETVSLKDVYLRATGLSCLLGLSYIKHLSLSSCSFECAQVPFFLDESVKTLKFEHCKNLDQLISCHCCELESFTFVSGDSVPLHLIDISKCNKLRHASIRAHRLKELSLFEYHENLEAVLDTPNLDVCRVGGVLLSCYSQFHLKCPKEITSVEIVLWELWGTSTATWEHFSRVREFLQHFSCARGLTFYIRDHQALILPRDFRDAFPGPIFPSLESVRLEIVNPPHRATFLSYHLRKVRQQNPTQEIEIVTPHHGLLSCSTEIIKTELLNSLIWLAPSLKKITTCEYPFVLNYSSRLV